MSDSLVVISPKSLTEAKDLASTLSAARTIPEALQKSPADVLAILMAGAELGLAPMQSIRALVLIKGKPSLAADAMVALVKSRKDRCKSFDLVESTATKATYKTVEVGGSESGTTLSFTMAEAQAAGIAGDMYRKYPAQMLRARCKAALCREVYPDLLLGVYDPEELAPEEPRDVTPRQVTSTTVSASPSLDAVKAALAEQNKPRRLNIVDGDAPAPQPSPPAAPSVETVGWGKYAATPLADLADDKLLWYLADAEKKASTKAGDESLAWAAHHARYVAEAARRAAAPAPFVAEVTP